MEKQIIRHIFIIGSKSTGQYGGYETFVDRLIGEHEHEENIKYNVACKEMAMGIWMRVNLTG